MILAPTITPVTTSSTEATSSSSQKTIVDSTTTRTICAGKLKKNQ
jgi:hypothetical protein